ncbi:immunoglobulin-like domain-containing receptor 2 isoform X2 [Syngnathoides biaculeatus]|uniref:immunoglobulin-like domain-containing receptor 2 isoform X2 n=1 Tax=Syngnathoides biaculeatus TaxID=300417 RepID=UPI002ADD702F|nr:immunoglobulin-like domain-containing receptor 2 isoform X2 [Syngnathoides biaculeatus]
MMTFHRLAVLLGALVCTCNSVHVTVPEKRQFAMLFQSTVLPCHYQTASRQTPVVQWWYKSYCHDRTRDSFKLPHRLTAQASEPPARSHLDCADSGRTVRVVASAQGSSMTLAEHYKNRDIAIINKADLRIGQLQWGDSGVYFCKVVIADDLDGKDEAHLELLVLGRTSQQADILPEFDVEIMPEWAFVGCVALGSILFLLLMGICWCQCCPHSCCCYVRCCCCPDTCCCPRHLYEAGKMAKSGAHAQMPVYPYYIPGVPTMVPLAPSSHVEPKLTSIVSVPSIASIPSVDNNLAGVRSGYHLKAIPDHRGSEKVLYYVEKDQAQVPSAKLAALQPGSLSELSSLHEGGNADFRHTYHTVQMKALAPIADADDQSPPREAPPARRGGRGRGRERDNHSDDELDRRWNARSEHLPRKNRAGSLDELEEFAQSYNCRSRRVEAPAVREYSLPRRRRRDEDDGWDRASPSPLPQRRRGTWDGELNARPLRHGDYDGDFLSRAMESKARGDGVGSRPDEDSDTLSKGGAGYCSRSPSHRPEEEDPLPPYSECEAERYRRSARSPDRYRTVDSAGTERFDASELAVRSFSYTRPHLAMSLPPQEKDRRRNLIQ